MSSVLYSSMDFGWDFRDLVRSQSAWSQDTFGSDAECGPMACLKHLEKEAIECQQAVGTDKLKEELADCLLLILDASRRGGITHFQLLSEAIKKLEINKSRTWSKPTGDAPAEHIRDNALPAEGVAP